MADKEEKGQRNGNVSLKSKPAEITVIKASGDVKIMTFSEGEIDFSNCNAIIESFGVQHREGYRWVFDLSNISFMDSEAIKSLITCIRKVGLEFAAFICDKGSMPFRVLELSGLAKIVSVYDNDKQAVESFEAR